MTGNEAKNYSQTSTIATSIAPWLSVRNGVEAVRFYKAAFGATEVYRMESPDGGLVARLSIDGAEFWLSGESPGEGNLSPESSRESSIRMILTVADPETIFTRALEAGASQVFPVGEEYGWKLGRLTDPFGHHWEIGHQLNVAEGV